MSVGIWNEETQTVEKITDGLTPNLEVYSTEETVIGTYLGKPLYRLVIKYQTLKNIYQNWTDVIDATNIKQVLFGHWSNSTTAYADRKCFSSCGTAINTSTNKVQVYENDLQESRNTDEIILEYTKITD